MAARITNRQAATTLSAVKSTLLVKRLQDHALADVEIMTSTQIRAAEILLNRTIPTLTSTQLTGAEGGPLFIEVLIAPHADNPRQD